MKVRGWEELEIEGKPVGVEGTPPLGERNESWECYESRSPKHFPNKGGARRERKCVVDLTGVTFIDKSGEKALAELSKGGAELIATGCYTRHVVHNIERKKSNRQW